MIKHHIEELLRYNFDPDEITLKRVTDAVIDVTQAEITKAILETIDVQFNGIPQ